MKNKIALDKIGVIATTSILPIPALLAYQIIAERFIFPYYNWGYYGYLLIGIGAFAISGVIFIRYSDKRKLWCIPGLLAGVLAISAYLISATFSGFQF